MHACGGGEKKNDFDISKNDILPVDNWPSLPSSEDWDGPAPTLPPLLARVTRSVCEKIAQNVAQPIFVKFSYVTITVEKVAKIMGYYFHFPKLPKIIQLVKIWERCCDF
jgi:hypothetical protein